MRSILEVGSEQLRLFLGYSVKVTRDIKAKGERAIMRRTEWFSKAAALALTAVMIFGTVGCSTSEPKLNETTAAQAQESATQETAAQESTAGQSQAEAEASGYAVEELKIGITKDITPRSLTSESGSFGRMNYNGFCAGTWMVRDENNEIQPNLMTSWDILEDGNLIRAKFATDQGITWHDGEPFTIDDIIFTVDFMNNVLSSGYLSKIESVDKVDDTTVDFHVKEGAAYFTIGNSAVFVRTYPKHIWENIEDPKNYAGDDATIGCGPYKLVSVDEEARTMHYEAVENWPMGKLAVHKVSVKSYDSQDAMIMALCNGEIDAINDYSNPISATMLPSIEGVADVDPGEGLNMGLFQILYGFKKKPTDDLAFRKAVRSALNYELLAYTIGGDGGQIPGEGIISPAGTAYDETLPLNRQDQEQAKAILDEAGYKDADGDGYREFPDGSKMDVLVTPQYNKTKAALYERIAEIIMQNLDEIGVKTTLDEESVRNSDHETEVRKNGAYEIYINYATQGVSFYKTPFLYMFDDPLSAWGTCTLEDFDTAYRNMLNAQGPEEYAQYVKELQKIASEGVVGSALAWDTAYYPYRTDKYEGWVNFPGWGVINYKTWYNLTTK